MQNKAVFILGPTSSGKTKLSLKIAKKFDGEIVNIDSQQAIKYLDIATSKIKESEKQGIPHHMLDIYSPDDEINVYDFAVRGDSVIKDISNRGKLPIIVGGTGLYARVLAGDIEIDTGAEKDLKLRKNLKSKKLNELQGMASKSLEYTNLNNSEQNNTSRLIRFIEKNTYSVRIKQIFLKDFKILKVAKMLPIDHNIKLQKSVTKMVKNGLIPETKMLLKRFPRFKETIKAIGYKEVIQYLDGEIETESQLIELITLHTRQYSKRQMTWLKKEPNLKWVKNDKEAIDLVTSFLLA